MNTVHSPELLRSIIRDAKRMSYSLIAQKYDLTRNQVAGVIWRHKNPDAWATGHKNGNGHHGPGKMPKQRMLNARAA